MPDRKEWPRLAADAVVRDILSRAQTQDRRPLLLGRGKDRNPLRSDWRVFLDRASAPRRLSGGSIWTIPAGKANAVLVQPCPSVGDALVIRECWRTEELPDGTDGFRFRADNAFVPIEPTKEAAERWVGLHRADGETMVRPWRPSIHLPRWACRAVLPIVRVWVGRIQEISEEDAAAEGCPAYEQHWWTGRDPSTDSYPSACVGPGEGPPSWMEHPRLRVDRTSARERFRALWGSLYPGSWERNDWVVCTAWDKPGVRR